MTQHEISTILQAIARLEVKVDGLGTANDKADDLHEKFDARISALEQGHQRAKGFAAAIGVLVGSGVGALATRIVGG